MIFIIPMLPIIPMRFVAIVHSSFLIVAQHFRTVSVQFMLSRLGAEPLVELSEPGESHHDMVEAIRFTVGTLGAKISCGRKDLLFNSEEERGFGCRA